MEAREETGFPKGFFELDAYLRFGNKPTHFDPDQVITRFTAIRINPHEVEGATCFHIGHRQKTIRDEIIAFLASNFDRTDPGVEPKIGIVAGYHGVQHLGIEDSLVFLRVDAEVGGVRRLEEPRAIPIPPAPKQKRLRRSVLRAQYMTRGITSEKPPPTVDFSSKPIFSPPETRKSPDKQRAKVSPSDRLTIIRKAALKAAREGNIKIR